MPNKKNLYENLEDNLKNLSQKNTSLEKKLKEIKNLSFENLNKITVKEKLILDLEKTLQSLDKLKDENITKEKDILDKILKYSSEIFSLQQEQKELNNQINSIKKDLYKCNALEKFSRELNDETIISYVDGHLTAHQGSMMDELCEIDPTLKKDIASMSKANSFLGKLPDDFFKANPKIIEKWSNYEQDLKKNKFLPAEPFFLKIRNIFDFNIINASFATLIPVLIGVGFLTKSPIIPKNINPAIIKIAELHNYPDIRIVHNFPGMADLGTKSFIQNLKVSNVNNCTNLKFNEINTDKFKLNFHVEINNLNTGLNFKLANNDIVLVGNKMKFYFKEDRKGRVFIDHISKDCASKQLFTEENVPELNNKRNIGNVEGYLITKPYGLEYLKVSFLEKNKNVRETLGIFSFTTTSLEAFEDKLYKFDWKKKSNSITVNNKGVHQLYSNEFQQNFYAPFQVHNSWGKNKIQDNKFEYIFIDFNGDNKAELVAHDLDLDGNIDYYLADRNDNQITDAIIYPSISNKKIIYDWLLDKDEDGKIDSFGSDLDSDWQIDIKKNL